MSNAKLFHTAGWGALASAVLMLAAIVSFMIVPMLGGVLETLALLLLIFVFYALHVAYSAKAKGLSLAGLALGIAAVVVDLFSMANYGNAFLSNLWYVLFSLPFLIFGYLAYRDSRMPRGLAIAALLAGVFFLVSGVGGFFMGTDFADNLSLIAILAMLVWLFWLWRVFWSKKFSAA
jgi:hypothetical protein